MFIKEPVNVTQPMFHIIGFMADIFILFILKFLHIQLMGESNGHLPLRICPECSVPEPYR
jgi:hypothetical protein